MRWKIGSHYLEQQLAKNQRTIESLDQRIRNIRSRRRWWQRILDFLTLGSKEERALRGEQQTAFEEFSRYEQGRGGEQRLFDTLQRICDDRYFYIAGFFNRNEGTRGDIDGILIGPHGITVYEAKSFTGLFKIDHDDWWYHNFRTQGWEPAHGQPTQQVKHNTQIVKDILKRHALPSVPIYSVVALASEKTRLDPSSVSSVPVVFVYDARVSLQQLTGTTHVHGAITDAICHALEIALASLAKRS